MTALRWDKAARGPKAAKTRLRDLRWDGRAVRVSSPVPDEVWAAVAEADPSTMPFQTPRWRDCVAASGWRDASRLYETPDGRQLVLMMARRSVAPGLALEASWPTGWGTGGVLAPGGVRPEETAMVCADIARTRALSVSVRPSFASAGTWQACGVDAFTIQRAVHVAEFSGSSFDDYWERSAPRKTRAAIRNAHRHLERAGVVILDGNSPDLVAALCQVYQSWIDWRAGQRKVPTPVARWKAARAEPASKFTAVASALGKDCHVWVAWWEGRPVAASISLYARDTAVGWRIFTDRTVPARFRLSEVLACESLRHAISSGCRYLEMGESVGRADLASFKERLGGHEQRLAEYCFERIPLAPGRMAAQRLRARAEQWVVSRGRASAGPPDTGPTEAGGADAGGADNSNRRGGAPSTEELDPCE